MVIWASLCNYAHSSVCITRCRFTALCGDREEIEAFKRSLNEEYERKISDLGRKALKGNGGADRELSLGGRKKVVAIQQDLNMRYDETLSWLQDVRKS
jgi:hypothetical protein